MLSVLELRIAFQQLPEAIAHRAELLIKCGEGGRGASLSQPQGPSVSPCYRQTLALSYTSADLGRQQFRPEVWSVLSDSACALQAPGNESTVAEGRQPWLCARLSQASLAAPLLYYPGCSL